MQMLFVIRSYGNTMNKNKLHWLNRKSRQLVSEGYVCTAENNEETENKICL